MKLASLFNKNNKVISRGMCSDTEGESDFNQLLAFLSPICNRIIITIVPKSITIDSYKKYARFEFKINLSSFYSSSDDTDLEKEISNHPKQCTK